MPDEDADVSDEAAGASEGETRTRLGADAGPEEADAFAHVEDADVVAADGVETWTRTRADGEACDDAEDAAAGEGGATLTRTRLGADAGHTYSRWPIGRSTCAS